MEDMNAVNEAKFLNQASYFEDRDFQDQSFINSSQCTTNSFQRMGIKSQVTGQSKSLLVVDYCKDLIDSSPKANARHANCSGQAL